MVGSNGIRSTIFREDDVRYVMQSLRTRKSCVLVGVDGIGKSSLMRHLVSMPVRSRYLGEHADRFIFLLLNSHELAKPSALAYYRRMASLLEPLVVQQNIVLAPENVLAMTNEEIAKQLLFDRVEAIVKQDDHRMLVFFFDEFDVAFTEVEPHFFRVLEALRSRVEKRICYVVASNNVPALVCDARTRKIVREMFSELFNGNVHGIRPLVTQDSYEMIEHDLAQNAWSCSQALRQSLLEITGSHPGMLQAAVAALVEDDAQFFERDTAVQITNKLLQNMAVVSQCEQLWNSLSEIEQHCLKQLQHGMLSKNTVLPQYSTRQFSDALQMLEVKGILIEGSRTSKTYRCFSPLLVSYVTQQFSAVTPGLQLDIARQQVWVDGELQTSHLTAKEFKLLRFLAEHAGEVCPREDTTSAVYGELYNPRQDDARLDALVERARRNIGDEARPPRFVETIRGMGHRLNEYLGERT